MNSVYAVCREILSMGTSVSPLKIIKLSYISHGFHLGYVGKPLFDDDVEAWQYGPVISRIYFAVSHFKKKIIPKEFFDHVEEQLDQTSSEVISSVMKTYDRFDGLQLSTITHRKNSPWHITVNKEGIGYIIPNDRIENHYKNLILENGNS